jgi:hypothetical protein
MKPRHVELHIEELVLHGFAPGDGYSISEAVQSALQQLLTEQGLPPLLQQHSETARLDGGAFNLMPHGTPATVGTDVAQAVYRGLYQ